MSGSPAPLQATGLHRFHRRGDTEVAALLDVGLTCRARETVAVIGPSGSGKSTLLSLLAGLDEPDGGRVLVHGRLLSHRSAAAAARLRARHLGLLTQQSSLLAHLTVAENVRLAGALRARARGVPLDRRADEALLDGLGIAQLRGALPHRLSGGETARAGLAVALAGGADVLLADEPTAEVGADEEQDVLELIRRCRPVEGVTVIVTHSEVVSSVADRVLRLEDGRVVAR